MTFHDRRLLYWRQGGEDELRRITGILLSNESRMTPAALLFVYAKALHSLSRAAVLLPVPWFWVWLIRVRMSWMYAEPQKHARCLLTQL